eukprot:scaffold265671_cov31-Tisochrysis_lutea.AAC.3
MQLDAPQRRAVRDLLGLATAVVSFRAAEEGLLRVDCYISAPRALHGAMPFWSSHSRRLLLL